MTRFDYPISLYMLPGRSISTGLGVDPESCDSPKAKTAIPQHIECALHLIHRKNPIRWQAFVAVCIVLFFTGCQHHSSSSSNPSSHVEQPFSIAKKGASAAIDFQVDANSFDLSKQYMVSLNFDRKGIRDPLSGVTGTPPRSILPVKVEVMRIVDGKEEKLPLIGNSQYLGPINHADYPGVVPEDQKLGIFYAYTYGWTSVEGSFCLVRFNIPQYGRYRIAVETLQDQPLFDGVNSNLAVEVRFNPGE